MKTFDKPTQPTHLSTFHDSNDTGVSREVRVLTDRLSEEIVKPELFNPSNYAEQPLHVILEYLRESHRYYLSKKLPEIEQQLFHLYAKFPEYRLFKVLYLFFQDYKVHLIKHIDSEERTVFTYVDLLLKAKQPSKEERMILLQGSPSLNHFIQEHHDTEKDLTAMRKILKSDDTYQQLHPTSMLLHQLSSLENHLNIHARLEDEVFVPKALELEKSIL